MIDIITPTWNRIDLLKKTVNAFIERTKTPFRMIIIDNNSTDGTQEYLDKLVNTNYGIDKLFVAITDGKTRSIAGAFDYAFQFVKSEYFITTNDDIIPPDLEPDWLQQLLSLIKKYSEHGGIDCRPQEVPSVNWNTEHPDLAYPRKSLGGYLRIQKMEDVKKMGGFGDRTWDDIEFFKRMTAIGKKCAYAKNIRVNHLGYMIENKGYKDFKDYPLYKESYLDRWKRKPYPKLDPKTNEPI